MLRLKRKEDSKLRDVRAEAEDKASGKAFRGPDEITLPPLPLHFLGSISNHVN